MHICTYILTDAETDTYTRTRIDIWLLRPAFYKITVDTPLESSTFLLVDRFASHG